jgi:hypothetical protein
VSFPLVYLLGILRKDESVTIKEFLNGYPFEHYER